VRRRLIEWYRRERRDLPWRRTRDPYRIWLSEAMLQQTRVETVVPYYERFVERFPDVETLADADLDSVLALWAGLGYYSRARNLKRAAELVVRDHGGRVPRDAAALGALPGIGRYTSGAIRSIAFREPAAIVDGNVARVLARLLRQARPTQARLWGAAAELALGERPDLLNQALMELGARVCTPRSPDCAHCPVARLCKARTHGDVERFPLPTPRKAPREVTATCGVLARRRPRAALLVVRRPARGLLGGLWELPSVAGEDTAQLIREIHTRTGLTTHSEGTLGSLRHVFSHRALTLHVIRLERSAGRTQKSDDVRWCTPDELAELGLSALMRKTLHVAGLLPSDHGARGSRG
jgi:A/G-specific adenine glycosylase